jgi:hypothetical protein
MHFGPELLEPSTNTWVKSDTTFASNVQWASIAYHPCGALELRISSRLGSNSCYGKLCKSAWYEGPKDCHSRNSPKGWHCPHQPVGSFTMVWSGCQFCLEERKISCNAVPNTKDFHRAFFNWLSNSDWRNDAPRSCLLP